MTGRNLRVANWPAPRVSCAVKSAEGSQRETDARETGGALVNQTTEGGAAIDSQ